MPFRNQRDFYLPRFKEMSLFGLLAVTLGSILVIFSITAARAHSRSLGEANRSFKENAKDCFNKNVYYGAHFSRSGTFKYSRILTPTP